MAILHPASPTLQLINFYSQKVLDVPSKARLFEAQKMLILTMR